MKKILMLLLISLYTFFAQADFLEPEEAMKVSYEQTNDLAIIDLKLGDKIYLYADKLKVYVKNSEGKVDLTPSLKIPEPVPYEEFIVHFDDIHLEIPLSLIKEKSSNKNQAKLEFLFQGCSKAGLCYAPMKRSYTIDFKANNASNSEQKSTKVLMSENKQESINDTDSVLNTLKGSNMAFALLTFFGFGLLLSLTPCIFPMIPILSSIIVKAGKEGELTASRGFFLSVVYVVSMSLAYTIAGVVAGLFGANIQVALQNPYVLIAFALIFVALAFSMFGYFKLELPQSLQNKINKTTDGKESQGILGIAVMGFLSALIVGPCVAPPLAGALIYIGQTGDAFLGGAALFVMSIGMGMPLLLIGLGAGKFMPKPGGWMESVSKIFGLVMLAVAIYMLDRVLPGVVVMYLWAFLLIGSALYLQVFRHIIARLITTVILIYGVILFVAAVSGASNPLNPLDKFVSKTSYASSMVTQELKWIKVKNLEDISQAVNASSKPVMLDFYADWCISCKELENITFTDPQVIAKLQAFTLLKADVTENNEDDKAMQNAFSVVGPPALIFWNTKNEEVNSAKIVGYKNPKDFLEIVNRWFK